MKLKKVLLVGAICALAGGVFTFAGCNRQQHRVQTAENTAAKAGKVGDLKSGVSAGVTKETIIEAADKVFAGAENVNVSFNWKTNMSGNVLAEGTKTQKADIESSISFDLLYNAKTGAFSDAGGVDMTLNGKTTSMGITYICDKVSENDSNAVFYGGMYDNDEAGQWRRMTLEGDGYATVLNYVVTPMDGLSLAEENIDSFDLVGHASFEGLDCYVMEGSIKSGDFLNRFAESSIQTMVSLTNKENSNIDLKTKLYFNTTTNQLAAITIDTSALFIDSRLVDAATVDSSRACYIFKLNDPDFKVEVPSEAVSAEAATVSELPGQGMERKVPTAGGRVFGGRL